MLFPRVLPFGIPLLLMGPLLGQDLLIIPKWKKDDTRTMFVTRVQQEIANDTLSKEVTDRLDARVKVSSMSATTYMVEMEYQNVILVTAKQLSDALGSEMDPWRKMLLRYEVNRHTGEAVLFNWQDVREVVNGSFSEIKRSLAKRDPEQADRVIATLDVLVSTFQDPAQVDAYFRDGIDMLTFAFNKPLTLDDPMEVNERKPNPLSDGKDTLLVSTTVHLDQLDKEAGRCTIRGTQVWQMDPFVETMKASMLTGATKHTGSSRSKAGMDKGNASIEFTMTSERTIVLDLESTWPIRVISESRISSRLPDGTRIRTTSINAEIR